MNQEEIKEYLKKVDELEFKLVDEDKDTLQWLIFGYNECARLLNEKEKENQELKDNWNKLKEYCKNNYYGTTTIGILDKMQELQAINKQCEELWWNK